MEFSTVCESPSIISFDTPRFRQIWRPCRASSSTRLLVVDHMDLALLVIHLPESLLMMHPIPTVPGLPLEAPSKFNLVQPLGGGIHLHLVLASFFFF